MKTICQLTLFVLAALLWATASSTEISEQTTPTFLFAPQASTGLAPSAVEVQAAEITAAGLAPTTTLRLP